MQDEQNFNQPVSNHENLENNGDSPFNSRDAQKRDAASGKFLDGNDFGAAGRPKGSRNKTTIMAEQTMEEGGLKVFSMTMDRALAGDENAQNLITKEFIKIYLPSKKSSEIKFDLPEIKDRRDVWQSLLRLVNATFEGELTVEEAQGRIDLLETVANNLGLSFARH
jgi:hypothetical protein